MDPPALIRIHAMVFRRIAMDMIRPHCIYELAGVASDIASLSATIFHRKEPSNKSIANPSQHFPIAQNYPYFDNQPLFYILTEG
jgi:hypothetical protein